MRQINKIIIHCADTKPEDWINAEEIKRWHVEDNKWSDIGYHFVITSDGHLEYGRPLAVNGAHCYGHNKDSIGICLVGGRPNEDGDKFYPDQFLQLAKLLNQLLFNYPTADIKAHRDFDSHKTCPNFDVETFLMVYRDTVYGI